MNFLIENKGQQYIEDATFEVVFPKKEGILIADKIYEKPTDKSDPVNFPQIRSQDSMFYPNVKNENDSVIIRDNIVAIKHLIPTQTFSIPIRLIIHPNLSGETIEVKCKIYAKNLTNPIIQDLIIIVI